MFKRIATCIALCVALSSPVSAAQLSTYPTLNLAKVAGVDSGGNVGLMTPSVLLNNLASAPSAVLSQVVGIESNGTTTAQTPVSALPCLPNIASPAMYYNALTGLIGCSTQVVINDTTLSVLAAGTLNFPDGGSYTASALQVTVPASITVATIGFGATQEIALTAVNQSNGWAASFSNLPTFGTGTRGSLIKLNVGNGTDPASIDYTYNGSFTNTVCIDWGGTCRVTFGESGAITAGVGSFTSSGNTTSPILTFSVCGVHCGFYSGAANQFGLTVNSSDIMDYGITSAGNLSINVPLGLKGYTVSTLPTGVMGQQAYVTDATACTYGGALTGSSTNYCKVTYNGTAWVGG